MRRMCRSLILLLCLAGVYSLHAQQVTLLGLRALNHAGVFHGLQQDAAGNLYTLSTRRMAYGC